MLLNKKFFQELLTGKAIIKVNSAKEAEKVIASFTKAGFTTYIKASQLTYPSYLGKAVYTNDLWNYEDVSKFPNIPVITL